ncbi:MAG: hypothetical protein PSX37_13985 [bacterium]|nr:hypothetical protein [bacterium]
MTTPTPAPGNEARRGLTNAIIGDVIIIAGAIGWAMGLAPWAAISIIVPGAALAFSGVCRWVAARKQQRRG